MVFFFYQAVEFILLFIDYDALALAPTSDSPIDFDQTRFSINDTYMIDASKKLVDRLRMVKRNIIVVHCKILLNISIEKKHKFTDIANFTLKCEQCNTGLKGEKGNLL